MNRVRVLFTRRRSLFSLLIRSWLHSPFSHCALIVGDQVVEADFFKGVRTRSLADALRSASYHQIIEIPCPEPERAYQAALSQLGKKYDWRAPLGVGTRTDWQFVDRWDCSELVAWAIEQGGRKLFRTQHHRISPMHLHLPHWF